MSAAQLVQRRWIEHDVERMEQNAAARGSFDNDVDVVGKTLERITGTPLQLPG